MINLKLLTALNVATSDDELLDVIDGLAKLLEDGMIAPRIDGDAITSFYLTEAGISRLPVLPVTTT